MIISILALLVNFLFHLNTNNHYFICLLAAVAYLGLSLLASQWVTIMVMHWTHLVSYGVKDVDK